jgi:hypothetical protein
MLAQLGSACAERSMRRAAGPPRRLRHACRMGEFIPLARAAIFAHDRVLPGYEVKDAKTLDLLALALSTLVPLYRRDERSDAVARLDAAQLAEGRFTRGATRLEFRDRAPLGSLMVARAELAAALETLARDPGIAARLGAISSRRRPPPGCSSARGPG